MWEQRIENSEEDGFLKPWEKIWQKRGTGYNKSWKLYSNPIGYGCNRHTVFPRNNVRKLQRNMEENWVQLSLRSCLRVSSMSQMLRQRRIGSSLPLPLQATNGFWQGGDSKRWNKDEFCRLIKNPARGYQRKKWLFSTATRWILENSNKRW